MLLLWCVGMNDECNAMQVVVGTHALLQPSVSFSQLGIELFTHRQLGILLSMLKTKVYPLIT
jgi:hypothetical protein